MRHLLSLLLFVVTCAGCNKVQQTAAGQASSPVPQRVLQQTGPENPKIAACKLITTDEVSAIQGAKITDMKSTASWSGNLLTSQCYYASMEPNKSVSLAVIQPNSRSTDSNVRKYWDQISGSFAEQTNADQAKGEKGEKRSGEAREEQETKIPRKEIDGVGEEAFWSGNRFGGALYVLKNDVIVRVSVGGPDDQERKIAKSKALAGKALSRLGF